MLDLLFGQFTPLLNQGFINSKVLLLAVAMFASAMAAPVTADVDGVANGVNFEGFSFQMGDTSTTMALQNATRGETHISDAVCIATDMLRCSSIVNGEQGECEIQNLGSRQMSHADLAEAGVFKAVIVFNMALPVIIMECFESASEASGGDQGTE